MSQSTSGSSGNSSITRKTGYNRHFPRSFLLIYGPALQSPNEEAVLNRLHHWNCEWLSRPNIAISELAMTIKDNMPLIRKYSGSIFVPEFVEDLLNSFDELLPALARMDKKDKTDQTPASREDVVSLLKNLDQNTARFQCGRALNDADHAGPCDTDPDAEPRGVRRKGQPGAPVAGL